MLDLKNIILVFIILFLLNQIKCDKKINKNKKLIKKNIKHKVIENLEAIPNLKENKTRYKNILW